MRILAIAAAGIAAAYVLGTSFANAQGFDSFGPQRSWSQPNQECRRVDYSTHCASPSYWARVDAEARKAKAVKTKR